MTNAIAARADPRIAPVCVAAPLVLLSLPPEPPLEPLRLAVCRTYQHRPREEGMFVAGARAVSREVAFAVDQLGPLEATALTEDEKLYGLPYPCLSRLG